MFLVSAFSGVTELVKWSYGQMAFHGNPVCGKMIGGNFVRLKATNPNALRMSILELSALH